MLRTPNCRGTLLALAFCLSSSIFTLSHASTYTTVAEIGLYGQTCLQQPISFGSNRGFNYKVQVLPGASIAEGCNPSSIL